MPHSRRSVEQRFWPKVSRQSEGECWLWQASKKPEGYGQLSNPEGGAPLFAHRVSFELHHGAIPHGHLVMHSCDVRACVNPKHLMLGTDADNAADKCSKGRHKPPRGEMVNTAKLTETQVLAIRASSATNIELSVAYGVSSHNIWHIRKGKSWRHI